MKKIQELTEFIVIKEIETNEYFICNRNDFKVCNYCETYDNYGNLVDSDDCHDPNLDNPVHAVVFASTYTNGSNYKSIIVGPNEFIDCEYEEIDGVEAENILSEMPANDPYVENGDGTFVETENYVYYYTLRDSFNKFSVEKK